MTELEQALLISGSIFAVMMASQYGRRDYTWHKKVMPLVSVAVFCWGYLHDAPTDRVDVVLYLVGAALGLGFGVWATVVTGVERDPATGEVHTTAGVGFVLAWLVAIAVRVVFIVLAQHAGWFREPLGEFMAAHRIVVDAIAPFFVLMATVMVASRVALIRLRVARLAALADADRPVAEPAPV